MVQITHQGSVGLRYRHHKAFGLEILGPPGGGKTTLCDLLEEKRLARIIPEVLNTGKLYDIRFPPCLAWLPADSDDDLPRGVVLDRTPYALLYVQFFKLLYLEMFLSDIFHSEDRTPYVVEHGPFDGLVWCKALETYRGKDKRFRIDSDADIVPNWKTDLQGYAKEFFALTLFISSIALIGVNQAESIRRRPSGVSSNSDFFDHLQSWYAYLANWLKENHLRQLLGYMILDGEQPLQANYQAIAEHIRANHALFSNPLPKTPWSP